MSFHSREEMIAELKRLPEKAWEDGVFFDVPKRRRGQQAMGVKQIRVNVPKDLQRRFATQINRYVEALGKEIGWDRMCQVLEGSEPETERGHQQAGDRPAGPPKSELPTWLKP